MAPQTLIEVQALRQTTAVSQNSHRSSSDRFQRSSQTRVWAENATPVHEEMLKYAALTPTQAKMPCTVQMVIHRFIRRCLNLKRHISTCECLPKSLATGPGSSSPTPKRTYYLNFFSPGQSRQNHKLKRQCLKLKRHVLTWEFLPHP